MPTIPSLTVLERGPTSVKQSSEMLHPSQMSSYMLTSRKSLPTRTTEQMQRTLHRLSTSS